MPRQTIRQRRTKRRHARVGRKTRRVRRGRYSRRMRGGLSNAELQTSSDPNTFATYYTVKYGKEHGSINPIDVKEGSVLVIVDMQNDFVDSVVTDTDGAKLTGPGGVGAFSVASGKSCIEGINTWVENNKSNLSKIILTRDWHHPQHCSFGIFPPHCVYNSFGADIVTDIKNKITYENSKFNWGQIPVDVIFKGFHKDTDSFGAAQYNDPEYLKTRQVPPCCSTGSCSDKTGGYVLNSTYLNKSMDKEVFEDADISTENTDELNKKYFNKYFWSNQIPQNTKDIYVVGLAGDYCVKDTAMNIKKLNSDFNVYVIQDLTRYAFVPMFVNPPSLDNVKSTSTEKPLSDYVFKKENGIYSAVAVSDLPNLTADMFVIPKAPKDEMVVSQKDEMVVSPKIDYHHFLSNQKTLIEDYNNSDIKLVYLPGGDVEKIINTLTTNTTTNSPANTNAAPNEG